MAKQLKDPGLGSKYRPGEKRLMNLDGTFNVRKTGVPHNIRDTYQTLIKMGWVKFFALSFAFILVLNLFFAIIYILIGVEHLSGNKVGDLWQDLSQAFFFSFQTFTTVGYGYISPIGGLTSFIAALESSLGLMVFAVITGLLYGRFSRPVMRLLFSKNAIIAPYQDGWALMFRVVNLKKSTLLEVDISVALTIHQMEGTEHKRKYFGLELEIGSIDYFPSSWTIVHPINDESPFNSLDLGKLTDKDIEVLIQLRAFNDTFAQKVHSRYSYLGHEIVVGAKFRPASKMDEAGDLVIPLDEFHDYDLVNYL